VTTFGYDANNNLTSVQLTTGARSTVAYADSTHPYYPTSSTDAQGNTTSVTYDAAGNVKTVSRPATVNGASTTISSSVNYNANGTVASGTDFNGNTTSYSYDVKGNLTRVTPPAYTGSTQLGPTVIVPDALSRPTSVTDGNNHQTSYTYDLLDRVTRLQYPDGATSYAIDADGNVTSMTEGTATTTYSYDARNRQTQKVLPSSGGTFTYGYDAASNLTSYNDAGGTVTYHYNTLNLVDTLTEPSGAQTTFAYDVNYHRTQTRYPDGVTMAMSYDNAQRIANVTATNATNTLVNLTYSYANPTTNADQMLVYKITENDAPGVGPYPTRQFTTTQSYDQRNMQVSWTVRPTAGGTPIHDYQYQFDANGNRTQIIADATVASPPANPKSTLTYNPVNELVTTSVWAMGAPSPSNTATWTYDAAGNQTGNSGYPGVSNPLTITYNQHNQTTSITDVYQHPVTMTYNGPGQSERTSADWSNQPSGSTPEYGHTTYANSALGLMSKTDTTGTTYYTKDPGGLPLGERGPNGVLYYVYDGQGNVVMVVDPPNGAPVAITDNCPTGNAAGGGWQVSGTHILDQLTWQKGAAQGIQLDLGTKMSFNGKYSSTNDKNGTQPNCWDITNPNQYTCTVPQFGPCGLYGCTLGVGVLKWLCEQGFFCDAEGGGGGSTMGPRAGARAVLKTLDTTEAQAAAANRAIGRATNSSSIDVFQGGNGSVVVRITRPGRDGYQVIESTVGRNGEKTVTQLAYDANGDLIHYDPKTT